jgi:hypothetical protein
MTLAKQKYRPAPAGVLAVSLSPLTPETVTASSTARFLNGTDAFVASSADPAVDPRFVADCRSSLRPTAQQHVRPTGRNHTGLTRVRQFCGSRQLTAPHLPPPRHPLLYEVNTAVWLDELSRGLGRRVTLAGVPDCEWDHLQRRGFDIVYLMGLWRRSALGRQLARSEPALVAAFDRVLPDWTVRDVAGSAFSIAGYEPDGRIGSWEDLADVRMKLHARGMKLMVDFIRITRFRSPWIQSHPDRYGRRTNRLSAAIPAPPRGGNGGRRCPFHRLRPRSLLSTVERRGTARLRSRYPSGDGGCSSDWPGMPTARDATWHARAVRRIQQHVEGISSFVDAGRRILTAARSTVRNFTLLAEVYWDLEWRLQDLIRLARGQASLRQAAYSSHRRS